MHTTTFTAIHFCVHFHTKQPCLLLHITVLLATHCCTARQPHITVARTVALLHCRTTADHCHTHCRTAAHYLRKHHSAHTLMHTTTHVNMHCCTLLHTIPNAQPCPLAHTSVLLATHYCTARHPLITAARTVALLHCCTLPHAH
jgi:hypothetical protein